MDKIHINLGKDSYDILIDTGLVRKAGPAIRDLTGAEKAAIITEDGIDKLYGMSLVKSLEEAGVRTQMIVVPSSEKSRTLQVVRRVYGALVDFGLGSSDTLIALGGRVVGDITGFTDLPPTTGGFPMSSSPRPCCPRSAVPSAAR